MELDTVTVAILAAFVGGLGGALVVAYSSWKVRKQAEDAAFERQEEAMQGFEHFGQWWDIEHPDIRWPGTLRGDAVGGAVLTVLESSPSTLHEDLTSPSVILGETTEGKDVTLLRCLYRSSEGGWQGRPRSRAIFADVVLDGFHGDGVDPNVSGADVVFRHANRWWAQTGLSVEVKGRVPDAEVRYRKPAEIEVFRDGDLAVSIGGTLASLPMQTDSEGNYCLREEFRVSIRSESPRALSSIWAIASACQDLLSVACQQYCDFERFLVLEVGSLPREATVHAVPVIKQRRSSRLMDGGLLFSFHDIKDAPQDVFTRWLTRAARLSSIRSLYSQALYGGSFIEARFFSLVQAVEGFHRRFRPGEYMDATKFGEAVCEPLWEAIPSNLSAAHAASLRAAIKYGNEYSLRTRLKALFKEHAKALAAIVPDADKLIHPIVEARNSFTHVLNEGKGPPTESEDERRYILVLTVLLEMCFLKVMGFSDEEIAQLASSWRMHKVRADYLFRGGSP